MLKKPDYKTARDLLLEIAASVNTEYIELSECTGRILAQTLIATDNVPQFDRSPYDGYAFRSHDTQCASPENPVTLCILEEIAAGSVPHGSITEGTAAKILTGAPIPAGADAVVKSELTTFSESSVTISFPVKGGSNIVRTGEDVRAGQALAEPGMRIDVGLAGILASQGITRPLVYRIPCIGIISTGCEIVEPDEPLAQGKIRDTNRHTLVAALKDAGCEPVYLGIAGDSPDAICALITEGLKTCDAMILTGGVSVGDYDMTPEGMALAGAEILIRGVDLKPGMACAYGVKDGKLIYGLSGNPASSITNYYAVVLPSINKLRGLHNTTLAEICVTLAADFKKKSPATRILRGILDLSDGTTRMVLPKNQGNIVLSSIIGCNVMAIVPAGSGPIAAGTVLKGFVI